ncbi:MAG TPA: serine/threonine-protein kinase, partial [Gemmatales bacterium]|nr:serine/threonine-protein kinase [Gemmatales bacterium]
QAKQLLAGRHRGFFLGQYKILDQLGQGGMGAVYIAEHTTLRRKVAIKVLHKDKSRDQKALERFFREARAAAALDHANIVRLHDIAQGSGVHFLVMEYVDGVTLQHLLERAGAMHYTQAVQYAAQVTAGLQHAHEKGFVHRDIKPANLILEKGGVVKILDMGLARSYEKPEDNLTANFNENTVQGTVDYISPEQAVGGKVDHRSDIYSLGTTLYALITGHAPFAGTTAQKLMGHQMTDPPKLSKLRASVPPALNGVVARMMAKQPEKRFQSCSEVIEALAPWLPVETLNSVVRAPARSVLDDSKVTRTDRKKLATTKKLKKKPKPFWKKYAIHLGAAALGLLLTVVLLVSALNRVEDTNKPVVAKGNSSSLLQNRDDIIDDRNY